MSSKLKLVSAMIIFGTISIFVKNIPLSSAEISFFRAIIAVIIIILFRLILGNKIKISHIKKELPLLFASGAIMGFNWVLLFEAYKYTTVSVATLSYYFAPVIVMVLSPFLFREKVSLKQAVCFIMSTIGLVLVINISDIMKTGGNINGIMLGLGAACCYATVMLLNKYIKNTQGIDRTVIQLASAAIILIIYIMCTGGFNLSKIGIKGTIYLLILGIVHTVVCYCLFFSALKELKGQQAAILCYIDPLISIIVSVTILSESITVLQIIGGVLILAFTLLNELNLKKS